MNKSQTGILSGWPSLLVTILVGGAALYSFAPRPIPPFPPTQIKPEQLLINGLARSGTRLIAVGEQGRILVADQASGPWREAALTPQRGSTLTQLAFIGEKTAVAVGHDSWIVRSEDNGETWKEVFFDAEQSVPLMGVAGPYAGKLFAYGAFGMLLVSTDDGKTWQRQTDSAVGDHHLNALTQAADGSLILVGERGLMLRSLDGGASWKALPQVYAGSFYGVLTLTTKNLVAFGMRGNVFYSSDSGASWKKSAVPSEPLSLFGGSSEANGGVTLVGDAQAVWHSSDGGATFRELRRGERKRYAAVLQLSDGRHLIAGETGIEVQAAKGEQP